MRLNSLACIVPQFARNCWLDHCPVYILCSQLLPGTVRYAGRPHTWPAGNTARHRSAVFSSQNRRHIEQTAHSTSGGWFRVRVALFSTGCQGRMITQAMASAKQWRYRVETGQSANTGHSADLPVTQLIYSDRLNCGVKKKRHGNSPGACKMQSSERTAMKTRRPSIASGELRSACGDCAAPLAVANAA